MRPRYGSRPIRRAAVFVLFRISYRFGCGLVVRIELERSRRSAIQDFGLEKAERAATSRRGGPPRRPATRVRPGASSAGCARRAANFSFLILHFSFAPSRAPQPAAAPGGEILLCGAGPSARLRGLSGVGIGPLGPCGPQPPTAEARSSSPNMRTPQAAPRRGRQLHLILKDGLRPQGAAGRSFAPRRPAYRIRSCRSFASCDPNSNMPARAGAKKVRKCKNNI